MPSTALTKPQMSGLLAKRLQCHIVGVIIVILEVAAFSKSTVDKSRKKAYTDLYRNNDSMEDCEMKKAGIFHSTK